MNLQPFKSMWHGSYTVLEMAVGTLVAGGHLLIEGPPGTGKTHLARLLALGFNLRTGFVQGTPDLMPTDIVGSNILSSDGTHKFRPGPMFCNLLCVDEINRVAPRTLSALLEAMQERGVTVDGRHHPLPEPFAVVATRSTREVEGVYAMPESALDRFLLSLRLSLPTSDNELALLRVTEESLPESGFLGDLQECHRQSRVLPVSERLLKRAVQFVRVGREDPGLSLGAGVRGSQALVAAARGLAWVRGDAEVTLHHLEEVALPVLSHRLRTVEWRVSTKNFVDAHWRDTDPALGLKGRFADLLH